MFFFKTNITLQKSSTVHEIADLCLLFTNNISENGTGHLRKPFLPFYKMENSGCCIIYIGILVADVHSMVCKQSRVVILKLLC